MNIGPYSDWTFDQVYEHVAEHIPELRARWLEVESYRLRHGAMFHACWLSLEASQPSDVLFMVGSGDAGGFSVTSSDGIHQILPSEHHAVVAACLIAKGIEVPR